MRPALALLLALRSIALLLAFGALTPPALAAPAASPPRVERHELRSPDGLTVVAVELGGGLRWSVARRGTAVLEPSPIGLEVEGRPPLGRAARARPARRRSVDERLAVPVPVRRRTVVDRHHELAVDLRDGLAVVFRAYDDAVAYRFADGARRPRSGWTERGGRHFRFARGSTGWLPFADCAKAAKNGADCFHTSFEELYTVGPLAEFGRASGSAFLPVLVDGGEGGRRCC